VLDSGGLSRLSERTRRAAAMIAALRDEGLWPPVVPTMVIAESTTGRPDRDANANRFLKTWTPSPAQASSTADRADLEALAEHADAVTIEVV